MKIDINKIYADEGTFPKVDANLLDELAEAIKTAGIIDPIKVTVDEKGEYVLVAGLRRLEAAKRAGVEEVEIEVVDLENLREAW